MSGSQPDDAMQWSKLSPLRAACVGLLLCLWAPSAWGQEQARVSPSESLRPIVSPPLIWRFDAGASVTTQPAGAALITFPRLGATVGAPGIGPFLQGFELSASVVDFVVSPKPPALGWVPQVALTKRLFPYSPVTAELRRAFELAFRLQGGVDPILRKPFRVAAGLPMAFRAAGLLRVDLTPGLGYQLKYERALFDAPLRVLLQPLDRLFFAAVSGVSIDLRDAKSTTIPLGAQAGLTITGDFGPLLDLIVEAGFPALFTPGVSHQTVHSDQFRVIATVRVFTFWDLNATDPDQSSDACAKRRRCGESP